MLELPEALAMAEQMDAALSGKRAKSAIANHSPHKWAWYTGDPATYNDRLAGKAVSAVTAAPSHIVIRLDDTSLVLSVSPRYLGVDHPRPKKHQLLVEFDDGTAFSATVQMWGALFCLKDGEKAPSGMDYNPEADSVSPLSDSYDLHRFLSLFADDTGKLSVKALLATEQRIPGLGNGVLQDILFNAGLHPKRKVATLTDGDRERLYTSLVSTLADMVAKGGRDTEKDFYGNPGGYATILSKNTAGQPCQVCGATIAKEAYLGGSIYYCGGCQAL